MDKKETQIPVDSSLLMEVSQKVYEQLERLPDVGYWPLVKHYCKIREGEKRYAARQAEYKEQEEHFRAHMEGRGCTRDAEVNKQ